MYESFSQLTECFHGICYLALWDTRFHILASLSFLQGTQWNILVSSSPGSQVRQRNTVKFLITQWPLQFELGHKPNIPMSKSKAKNYPIISFTTIYTCHFLSSFLHNLHFLDKILGFLILGQGIIMWTDLMLWDVCL